MGRKAKATEQYGDLRGSIAIDGFDHLMASDLLPKLKGQTQGFLPVGIELYIAADRVMKNGKIVTNRHDAIISVLAVDPEMLNGRGPEAVEKYAKENGQLPVFSFPTTLKLEDLLPLAKRISITIQDSSTANMPLIITKKG